MPDVSPEQAAPLAPRGREQWSILLDLAVEHDSSRPLFQQIYLGFRDAILARRLSPGSRLPSTRLLAERLGVSRTSVLTAYEQLLAEGFVTGRAGSGTFVAEDAAPDVMAPTRSQLAAPLAPAPQLSRIGQRYERFAAALPLSPSLPFAAGCCSVDALSIQAWRRTGVEVMQNFDPSYLSYSDPSGDLPLREEVAKYLRAARAVRCEPEQILILSGAQQAIDLSIRVLLNPGDAVWVEDPGYLATREALAAAGASLIPVPVDREGMVVEAGLRAAPQARAAYITPSHQYPTGSIMSIQRRLELLSWAKAHGAWIIEDDYDGEFRYVGRPLASLQGLEGGESVIYVGTLSKMLFPGARIGFAVVPPALIGAFRGARFLTDRNPPTLQQALVTAFMRRGFLTSHIQRMRQRYRAARDIVVEAITRHMGDLVEVEVPECGIQLTMHFRQPICDVRVVEAARRHGVVVKAVSPHYLGTPARSGLVLGYSGFDAHRLRSAAALLAQAVREVAAEGQPSL
ncbi:MocR-like pyridoxine biosynthesis transcription factor PdxR [Rhodovarius lipocyclicus]|uniref:MocR-like pyridoxine biosynthesis transcription factor PdxR n=1 Tax=Rhodovarius lipocyclicus TaxID=268410 RepID=UPI00135C3B26|nr:PLP-dependent aminotransferase family protein [Rhodovarius lipocyclicus]